jgi:membrane protease YdiL (CAAX protease family)
MPARASLKTAAAFVLLAFAMSWVVWIPLAVTSSQSVLKDVGSFGPAAAAVIVVLLQPTSRAAWFARFRRWGLPARWYLLLLAAPVAVCLAAAGVAEWAGAKGLEYNDPAQLYLVVPAFLVVLTLGGPLGEEPGWRGLLQPLLAERLSPRRAGLVVGLVWATWHLPLFAIPDTPQSQLPPTMFLGFTIALGVVYGWVAERTRNSVPAAIVLHAASNTAAGVLPVLPQSAGGSVLPFALVTGVTVMTAAILLLSEAVQRRS